MPDYGIDVSHHQTLTNAAAVARNDISFAWIKATEGADYRDQTMSDWDANFTRVGIKTGAYHFARPGAASGQARFFRGAAGPLIGNGHLLPVLDMEDNAIPNKDAFITTFYDALNAPAMVVYANLDWWRNRINPAAWGNRNIYGWIARYNGDPGNPGWTYPRMLVHQHTETGNVPGFTGRVDRNVTMAGVSLAQFVQGAPKPAATMTATREDDDMPNPVDLWAYKGKDETRDAYWYLRQTYAVDVENQRRINVLTAGFNTLADAMGKNQGVDAAALKTVLADALKDATVSVDVNVSGGGQAPQ